MNLDEFKAEYTRTEVTLKDIDFIFKKIPALEAAFIFVNLAKKLFRDVSTIDFSGDEFNDGKSLIFALVAGLDTDYLEHEITPKIFKYIDCRYVLGSGKTHQESFMKGKSTLEKSLGFDDILELIVRGLCVNFLDALSERMSTLARKD